MYTDIIMSILPTMLMEVFGKEKKITKRCYKVVILKRATKNGILLFVQFLLSLRILFTFLLVKGLAIEPNLEKFQNYCGNVDLKTNICTRSMMDHVYEEALVASLIEFTKSKVLFGF